MITRKIDKAREAFSHADVEESRAAHDSGDHEPHASGGGQFLKSFVYGGLDGIITTFAVVAGVAGASLDASIILILGFANLIADGVAMAFGDFLSTRAEQQYQAAERRREEWELENYPEGERREMINIYVGKGFSEEEAETVVEIFARHPSAMVDAMMAEELGIIEEKGSPIGNALVTFGAFVVFGFVPLLIFVADHLFALNVDGLLWSGILTGATLFALGVAKAKFSMSRWWKSGSEMLLLGGTAAVAAFFIGRALESLS